KRKKDDEGAVHAIHNGRPTRTQDIETLKKERVGESDAHNSAQNQKPVVVLRNKRRTEERFVYPGPGGEENQKAYGVFKEIEGDGAETVRAFPKKNDGHRPDRRIQNCKGFAFHPDFLRLFFVFVLL